MVGGSFEIFPPIEAEVTFIEAVMTSISRAIFRYWVIFFTMVFVLVEVKVCIKRLELKIICDIFVSKKNLKGTMPK